MNLAHSKHPIWTVLSLTLGLVGLGLCLSLGYSSEFDSVKDLRTMVVVGTCSAIAEFIRSRFSQ